VASFLLPEF